MTIRDDATHLGGIGIGLKMAGHEDLGQTVIDLALNITRQLDNSRETTEKKTHVYIDPAPGWIRDRYQVTNHKARVVLDD